MLQKIIILCFLHLTYGQFYSGTNNFHKLVNVFSWNQLEYDFDGILYTKDTEKRWSPDAIYFPDDAWEEKDQFFTQYNNIPIGFEVYRDIVFVTVPRRRYGIPSTLNYVNLKTTPSSAPALKPYPCVDSIRSFVSVYRPKVDVCDRLWMVDTGLLEVPGNRVQMKMPEIIVFDLKTDREILRYPLKATDLSNGTTSGLTSITIDVTLSTCDDAFAYINDLAAEGMVVFSLKQRDSWRFSHSTMAYDVGASNFKIGENVIDWKDGLFSIALSDPDANGVRKAYYHPFVATQEFSITTDVLKSRGDFEENYKLEGVRGAWSQSTTHAYHSTTKTLLFANVAQDGILCWNVDKPLTPKNTALVAQHHKFLLYISDLKIVGEDIYVLVNQITRFIYSTLNTTEPNFFMFKGKIADLIANSVCESKY